MTRQLVQPNFSIVENAGWCLQYARRVFGAPVVESTAWQGWMMTEHPHEDRNFPQGVAVPVWFDWKGDVGDGHIFRYGHAAVRAADGKIWSSPLSGKGSAWFNSVDDLTRAFGNGMRYVGWSEDISNVKVIELGEDMSRIQELEEMANNRQKILNDIAAMYSIPAPLDGNNLPQLINNIKTEKRRIDELTVMASNPKQATVSLPTNISKEAVIDYLTKNLK